MPRSAGLTAIAPAPLTCYFGPLVGRDAAAGILLRGAAGFVSEHPFLGAAAARTALAAEFFKTRPFRSRLAGPARLDFVEQQLAGEQPIEALLAGGLALDPQAGRPVQEHHTGRGLVDVLPAMPAGADKSFFEIVFAHSQGG